MYYSSKFAHQNSHGTSEVIVHASTKFVGRKKQYVLLWEICITSGNLYPFRKFMPPPWNCAPTWNLYPKICTPSEKFVHQNEISRVSRILSKNGIATSCTDMYVDGDCEHRVYTTHSNRSGKVSAGDFWAKKSYCHILYWSTVGQVFFDRRCEDYL